jgi:hypothetical protein
LADARIGQGIISRATVIDLRPKRGRQNGTINKDDTMEANRKSLITGWWKIGVALAAAIAALLLVYIRVIREPPVYAPLTPAQEQAVFVKSLRGSGEAPEKLLSLLQTKTTMLWDAAIAIGKEQLPRNGGLVDSGQVECFRGGCMREMRFTDRTAAGHFEENLLIGATSPLRLWPGRIYRGPFSDDGEHGVTAVWALLIDPAQHRHLEALSRVPHAMAPMQPPTNGAISGLQQGE